MVKPVHISWPFWSSRRRVARDAGSGSIFGRLSPGKSRIDTLVTRNSYWLTRHSPLEGRTRANPAVTMVGAVNPTLTIIANALRVAEIIKDRL